jgi:hypothetical protein
MKRRLLAAAALFAAVVLGLSATLTLAADEPKKDEPKKDDDKWVQIFNGKNLNGWVVHPEDKARWSVQDGAIVGEGPVGHLYTERGDYENFRFRIEAMISDGGNSGQYFRTEIAKGFPPAHYEAQINATHADPQRTGSLYGIVKVLEQKHKPNEWFTQEVIADGDHIVIILNGETVVDTHDSKYTKGHLGIQQHNEGSVVHVRKADVIELPPTKPKDK